VRGILFKFASDIPLPSQQFLYGGPKRDDGAAMKVANHELKSLSWLMQTAQYLSGQFSSLKIKICFPLMTIIDYR
jgi:hypothetical protein